jgi:hypothetical protein
VSSRAHRPRIGGQPSSLRSTGPKSSMSLEDGRKSPGICRHMLGAERNSRGGFGLGKYGFGHDLSAYQAKAARPNFRGLRMSFRAGTGYRRPRAAFGIPPCTDAALVVNEAMTAAGVTWAGDRTLAWRPEPSFVPRHDVTMRRGPGRLPKGLDPPCQQRHARLLSTTGTRLRPPQPQANLQLPGTMRRMGRKVAGATCPV